jgi:hypothetical protein
MIEIDVNGSDPKNFVGNCRHLQSTKRGHVVVRKLADRTGYIGRTTKCSIIGGGIHLPTGHWYVLLLNVWLNARIHAGELNA